VPVETLPLTHTIYTRTQLLRFSQDGLVDIVLEMQEKGCAFKLEGFQLIYGAVNEPQPQRTGQTGATRRHARRYNTFYFIFAKVNFKA
jgi:hypothetical protein